MTEKKLTVTRPDFEELIGRALAIQERSGERVELERARAIAMELGVSPEAWEEALEERRLATVPNDAPSAATPGTPTTLAKPLSIAALSSISVRALAVTGASIGFASAMVASRLGGIDVPLGAAGYVVGTFLAIESARRDPSARRVRITAWWTSISAGMMLGIGSVHPDPIVYGAVGWLISEAAAWIQRRLANT